MTRVLGVDGSPDGWVLADPDRKRLAHATDLGGIRDVDLVAIDIPLAFPNGGEGREAERAARQLLGRRASSVFSTPPREVYDAESYEDACAIARQRTGKAISRQAWGLRAKVLEAADALATGLPLVEAHPETAFTVLGPGPCAHAKTTFAGVREREGRLREVGLDPGSFLGPTGKASPHDVLDAIVLGWVAQKHRAGGATRLGGDVDPIWT